jgi:endonuclease-3 related protein
MEAGADIEEAYGFNSSGYHPGIKYIPGSGDIFEIAAGAVLTQNTSWNNAASAVDNLILAGCLDPLSIRNLDTERLSALIRVSGYHNQKAKKLKALAGLFLEGTSGELTREKLLAVWGIGPETADSIMLYGLDQPFFVIDAYSRRILSRFLSFATLELMDYEKLRLAVESAFPAKNEAWREYHALLVIHGKKHCRKSPDCHACPIKSDCMSDKY